MRKQPTDPLGRTFGWKVYFALLLLRFILVFSIQPGYLHPDEFFQSVEIGASDVYALNVFRSWEFLVSDKGPIRSIAGLGPLVHLPLWISKSFSPSITDLGTKQTDKDYFRLTRDNLVTRVLLPVRLQTVLFSLTVDLFILVASAYIRKPCNYGRRWFFFTTPPLALLLYASAAFGGLLFAGRTLANTWEMAAVALFSLLALTVIRNSRSADCSVFTISSVLCTQAVLSVWATFLRTSYPLFISPLALYEICVLLYRYKYRALFSGSLAVLFSAVTIQICLQVDTAYFTGSNPFVWQSPANLLCIPCRFVRYNSRTEHLSEHGLHPPYLHLLVNVPLIFGPVFGFLALWPPCAIRDSQTLLWVCVVFPLLVLSSVPHQEARFLLPLIPFVLTLAGRRLEQVMNKINQKRYRRILFGLFISWCLQQALLTLIFGWFHQAGIISYLNTVPIPRLGPTDFCPVHIFYHTYMPPRFPLGRFLNEADKFGLCHDLIDLGGSTLDRLGETLNMLHSKASQNLAKQWIVHLVYPGSLAPMNLSFEQWTTAATSTTTHFGHLSLEDPPYSGIIFKQLPLSVSNLRQLFDDVLMQLSLHVTVIRLS